MVSVGDHVRYNAEALATFGIVYGGNGKELHDPKRTGRVVAFVDRPAFANIEADTLALVKWADDDRELTIHPCWIETIPAETS